MAGDLSGPKSDRADRYSIERDPRDSPLDTSKLSCIYELLLVGASMKMVCNYPAITSLGASIVEHQRGRPVGAMQQHCQLSRVHLETFGYRRGPPWPEENESVFRAGLSGTCSVLYGTKGWFSRVVLMGDHSHDSRLDAVKAWRLSEPLSTRPVEPFRPQNLETWNNVIL